MFTKNYSRLYSLLCGISILYASLAQSADYEIIQYALFQKSQQIRLNSKHGIIKKLQFLSDDEIEFIILCKENLQIKMPQSYTTPFTKKVFELEQLPAVPLEKILKKPLPLHKTPLSTTVIFLNCILRVPQKACLIIDARSCTRLEIESLYSETDISALCMVYDT